MGVWYATREDVKSALDWQETARKNSQVDTALESASRAIDGHKAGDGFLHRRFYPLSETRYFDWPPPSRSRSYRLWLHQHELISVSLFVSGGVTIPSTDYFLRPYDGPPYTYVEIDLSSSSSFSSGSTWQQAIAITGVWGYGNDTAPAGALAEALDNSETGVDVTNSAIIGVGDIIKVESEYMIVTDKSMLDTGQNMANAAFDASKATNSFTVADGTQLNVDETILIDSERMRILDISGNTITVERGFDGSTLAAHSTNQDIYAPRTLTVQRGSLGTTAASHNTATAVSKHVVPGLVKELCIAYAINNLFQRSAAYARVVGGTDTAQEFQGRGISEIEKDAYATYGRKVRMRAV